MIKWLNWVIDGQNCCLFNLCQSIELFTFFHFFTDLYPSVYLMGRPNTLVFSSQRLRPSSLIDSTCNDTISTQQSFQAFGSHAQTRAACSWEQPYKYADYLYTSCAVNILVVIHLSGHATALICVIQLPTACPVNLLTHTENEDWKCVAARVTYMSEQRLLSESADQSFSVHLAQPQDVQRTTI